MGGGEGGYFFFSGDLKYLEIYGTLTISHLSYIANLHKICGFILQMVKQMIKVAGPLIFSSSWNC